MGLTQITTGGVDDNINIDNNTLKVDGTNNRVGIGVSNPAHELHVAHASTPEIVAEDTTNNVKAYLGSSDSNGRIGTLSNHHFQFRTHDVERMRLDTSGNLSIGHAGSPDSLLTIGGNAITTAKPTVSIAPSSGNGTITIRGGSPTLSFDQTGGGDGTIIYDNGSDLLFKNGTLDSSSEVARINDSGSLLIGSSTAATAGTAQYAYLQIAGNTAGTSGSVLALKRGEAASQMSDDDSLGTIIFTGTTGGDFASIRGAVDGSPSGSDFPGRIVFSTCADGANSPTEVMRITSTGRVGIGATEPGNPLHIADQYPSIRLQSNSGSYQGRNTLGQFDNILYLECDNDNAVANSAMAFTVDASEKMRLTAAGHLGIGTSSPARPLTNGDDVTLTTGNAPQYRLNGGAGDSNDNDRAIFGLATGTNHFFSGAVAGDTVLRTTNGGNLMFGTGTDERMRIASNGYLKVSNNSSYVNSSGAFHEINQSATGQVGVYLKASSSAFASDMLFLSCNRVSNSNFYFFVCRNSNTANNAVLIRGDGNAFIDGSWNGGGADYAEYFEWSDGNTEAEDRRGISVVLDGDKIREAVAGEEPIGVISGNPSVAGDADVNQWKNKHLRDDYGSYVLDENGDSQINPDYNPDTEYVSRENRPEWDTVGLMGKLRIRKGQVTGARWIKMRDVSSSVEEWLVR